MLPYGSKVDMNATTDERAMPASTLCDLRTRCATIARLVAGEAWSHARVHQLRVFSHALHEQVMTHRDAGMAVGVLLLLSERLTNAIEGRAREEAQAAAAAFGASLDQLAAGETPDDTEMAGGELAAPPPLIAEGLTVRAAEDDATAPVREHGGVSDAALATLRDLGCRVRQARLASGMSQGHLAAASGVGRRFVSELESGKPTLEIGRVLLVCMQAGVPMMLPPPVIAT
jgi:DNA-binding XRE family transcriptional regulator